MKAFLMTDLEGVAGVVTFEEHAYRGTRLLDRSRKLLTAEVNACVQGLLEAGATEITVLDGHGDGGVDFEDLHAEARLIHGRPISPAWTAELEGTDIALFVGQHAMAGVPDGNLNHTQDSRSITSYTLNGTPIGEIGQFALLAGTYGVPVVFLSGDRAACREAEALIPGVTTVAVKEGLGRTSAVSYSAAKAREMIQAGVTLAVAQHGARPAAPLVWPAPYVLEKRFFTTESMEHYRRLAAIDRHIEIVDPLTVRIRSTDLRAVIYE